ncbi:unnamed protein product [Mytilus edulis]|uniref:Uncharacterized protein n=1 Tax=Mytilus edulis TaxID=6550 RepID=A0A8S3TNI5_MYTED|nr:unnamed protein product [Mytilus edulis]
MDIYKLCYWCICFTSFVHTVCSTIRGQCNKTRSFQTLTQETRYMLPGAVMSYANGELKSINQSFVNIKRRPLYPTKCDVQLNYKTYSQRALCPWTFVRNIDENRIPREITEAKCLKEPVTDQHKKTCRCKEIKFYTYVLRTVINNDGVYQNRSILEPISAGCACINRTSKRKRITMSKC